MLKVKGTVKCLIYLETVVCPVLTYFLHLDRQVFFVQATLEMVHFREHLIGENPKTDQDESSKCLDDNPGKERLNFYKIKNVILF